MVETACRLVLLALVSAGAGAACTGASAYACSSDAQCVDGGVTGYCESSGYCSFEDGQCESGRRYGSLAPADLAGECTLPADEATGSQVSSSTQSTDAGSSGVSASTGSTDASSATTSPVDPPTSSDESTAGSTSGTSGSHGDESSSSSGPDVPTCTTVFADDFEDGVLDPAWYPWASAGCSYAESGGAMSFSVGASDTEWVSAGLALEAGPVAGGWVRAELVPFDPPLGAIGVWLTLYTAQCELQIAAENSLVHGMANGVWFEGDAVATDEPLWLQLRVDTSGVAYWEWSTDGETWNLAHSEPTPCEEEAMQSALFAGGMHGESVPITRSVASYERCDPP